MKGFYKDKKLLQVWVSVEDHAAMEKLASEELLQVATYLRQVVHEHVKDKENKKARRKNGVEK